MDDVKPQEPQQQQASTSSLLSRTLNVLAYPVAAITGYFTADTATRSMFYAHHAKLGRFNDLQAPTLPQLEAATRNPAHVVEETIKIQNNYRYAVNSRIQKWGYSGVGDLWKCLSKNQRIRIFTEGMTVTGISFGAMLLLSQNIDRLKGAFKAKEKGDDQSVSR